MQSNENRFPLLRNRVKGRIAARRLSLCLRTTLVCSNEIAFLADGAGFDALYVDLEHSTMSINDAAQVCATATALGVTPLVRLPSVDDHAAGKLLDAGCQGIIAAHVESQQQAQQLVDRCLFPPLGRRSTHGRALQLGYEDVPPAEVAHLLNEQTLLIVMLESAAAVAVAGDIAAVQGIDLLLVGTQDLSADLGVPGDVEAPAVVRSYEQVAAAATAAGTAFGVAGVADLDVLSRYAGLGATFITAGSDRDLLRAAAAQRVQQLRGIGPS